MKSYKIFLLNKGIFFRTITIAQLIKKQLAVIKGIETSGLNAEAENPYLQNNFIITSCTR